MDFSEILLPKEEIQEFGSDYSDWSFEDGLRRDKETEWQHKKRQLQYYRKYIAIA